jgi:dTDP-L-rhamnose 4-epimerase
MSNIKNILITGGAGFIGSHLALKLLEKRYSVSILDNLSSQIHGAHPEKTSPLFMSIKDKVHFFLGDVRDKQAWINALPDIDCIVHLAAETGTGQSMYEIEKYVDVNIGGTALMLDILTNTAHQITKVIVAESRAIYGEGKYFSEELNQNVYPELREKENMERGKFEVTYPGCKDKLKLVATDESSVIHPTSVYGITKQVQGQLVHLVCSTIRIDSVSYRYQNVYGPGQSLSNPYTGILSIFSTRIKNGNGINIFEDGLESRDFVYINDVVDATILGIEKKEAAGHTFNVGSGVPIDVLTVAKTLMDKYGIEVAITISGNYRLGDIRHNFADITKIKHILGFEPQWTFSNGITEFVNWVNKQDIQQDKYDESIKEMKAKGFYK